MFESGGLLRHGRLYQLSRVFRVSVPPRVPGWATNSIFLIFGEMSELSLNIFQCLLRSALFLQEILQEILRDSASGEKLKLDNALVTILSVC